MANSYMGGKVPLVIPAFGGIDTRHTRQLGFPSDGKNFWTRSGDLLSREGCSAVTGTFGNPIEAMFGVAMTSKERLLVEEGNQLWHRPSAAAAWVSLKSNLTASKVLGGSKWQTFLILGNGTDHLAYDIDAGTLAVLGGTPPAMEFFTTWKFRIFGWSPNGSNPNNIWFCGYAGDDTISKDVWPATYFLRAGEDVGSPVLCCIPYQTHMVVLTQRGFSRIYGDDETNFSITEGGSASVYNAYSAVRCGDYIIWLGLEDGLHRVYMYTGTAPTVISQPIHDILQSLTLTNLRVYAFAGQVWFIFPGASDTTVLVYDTAEQQWYKLTFGFAIKAACVYSSFLGQEYLHLGLSNGTLAKMDSSVSTDLSVAFTTEFSLGPFSVEDRRMKLKSLYIDADVISDFTLSVYAKADSGSEVGPRSLAFTGSDVVSQRGKFNLRGQHFSLRVTTTDKINNLNKGTIVVVPGAVK